MKVKRFHVVFFRVSFKAIVITILTVIVTTVLSCDEEERYKTLTFFFDGVPPLKSDDVNDVNSPDKVGQKSLKRNVPTFNVHEPSKVCENCHDMTKKPRWATPEFVKEPLQLCYDCHPNSNYSGSVDYVHGPVAIGDCMRCHNPHRSKQEHLLKIPVPDVCYRCHEKADMESIEEHPAELLSECLDCHVGHSSPARGLLREGWNADPNERPESGVGIEGLNTDPNERPESGVGDELLMLLRDDM
ncbi:MAG: cytochrome c3 family protein [Planctomycetota bacterium]